jgi:hypothetical protein
MTVSGTVNNFTQCLDSSSPEQKTFSITFSETNVANAFKTMAEEGPDATQGTRLLATFTNVPAGVTIMVSDSATSSSVGGGLILHPTALFVPGADANGNGGTFAGTGAMVKALVSGSTQYAVWEVTSDNLAANDTLVFDAEATFTANPGAGSPGLTSTATPTTVTGSFAPVSTDLLASATDVIPRFQNTNLTQSPLFTIVPCITNLLFPYVTNTQGYDTGLAIVNTSMDVFGTSTQSGACTLNFFGSPTVAAFTTPTVDPGTVYAQVLENVGAAGFQGYIIAQCNFQYGHGLAFIVNPGGVGTQYLALVIPNLTAGSRPPDPFSAAPTGSGEQLGE